MREPQRRHVLVTGIGSGIGRSTALHLAERGFRVTGAVRDEDDVDDLLAEAAGKDLEIEPVALDVADPAACERVMAGLELYGLVNNAGFYNVGAVEDVPRDHARRQLETMVLGPIHLAQLALPSMRAAGRGRIVNISSSIVYVNAALTGWYQTSKQAFGAISDALRIEVASAGVDVVLVEPGGVRSDIWRKAEDDLLRLRDESIYQASYDRALKILRALEGRMPGPGNVAEVVGRALTAERPRARYGVGVDNRLLRFAGQVVPDRARDRLVRAILSL